MKNRYEVRFAYGFSQKTVPFDSQDAADRYYQKVIHHATNRTRPLHGTVALWNGRWRIKYDNF